MDAAVDGSGSGAAVVAAKVTTGLAIAAAI
jgi:hypothetical protein